MELNYSNYPTLLFLSYTKDNAPDELPFEVSSAATRDFLTTSKGYKEVFPYIIVRNSIAGENTNTNYLLNDAIFSMIDNSETFRNNNFRGFFKEYVKPKHGAIVFQKNGQYVYSLWSKQDTKRLKGKDGRYMAVSLFTGNFFVGYEEGIIGDTAVNILKTGKYEGGMNIGGYLSFCMITLAHANGKELKIFESDSIKEKIYIL